MSDRLFFGLAATVAILLIALAAVTPQGLGVRSPGPFGHPVIVTLDEQALSKQVGANPKAAAALAGLRSKQ